MEHLVAEFDQEMFRIYERARSEANYNATRFLHMLYEHRGLEIARILLHSTNVSEGYTALWERGRLDLTVEAVIHVDGPTRAAKTTLRLVGSGPCSRR